MRRGESKNREKFPVFPYYSLPYNSKMASWRGKVVRKNRPEKLVRPEKFPENFRRGISQKNSAV